MIQNLKIEVKKNMNQIVRSFEKRINKIRSEKIDPNILEKVSVFCYGSQTPLNKISLISSKNSHTLSITVFDHSLIKIVKEEILKLRLDCQIFLSENVIKLVFPLITEERRKNLIKIVQKMAETEKISIRKIRKVTKDKIKTLIKSKKIDEDNGRVIYMEIQDYTDTSIKKIDVILKEKERSLLHF
ncbi:ribosome-recycling factor [Candidatus Riesia pediculicola]|uniref:ribosome-recycling factor n=1 Tax=Candidatus Riesia pediculicola TaxID=401619 RepID=UPI0009C2C2D2|nr:ribosome-recycling factor [Candidatus Riesia pediculicola]ARC54280.1 hypothetical protein AOE57_01590 [Candidatus Riesia pediculicola]